MMKKIFIILLSITPCTLCAQNSKGDSIQKNSTQSGDVTISRKDFIALNKAEDELHKLQEKHSALEDSLTVANKEIAELTKSLKVAKARNERLSEDSMFIHREEKRLKEELLNSHKHLINMASNFLYIPYEQYSIDSIAIPSFKAVSEKELSEKFNDRYELLNHYKEHINDLIKFLDEQQKELNKGFKNEEDAEKALDVLHRRPFYKKYQDYYDWESTFLGRKIVNVENQLKSFNGHSVKVDFDETIKSLKDCFINK